MAENSKKTYWPHMILGFLIIGFTLAYWTVKSASSLPVQEVNKYMLKYQMADMHINEILEKKDAFDKAYKIALQGGEMVAMTDNIHSKLPQPNVLKLAQGANSFSYKVVSKDGKAVSGANVTFLLTQPHSRKQDKYIENIPHIDGLYQVKNVEILQPGRYTLQLKVEISPDKIGYSEIPAYLKP
jgi:hypothetical protein